MCPESRRSRRRAGGGLDLEATASWKTDGRALDRDTGRTWKTDDGVEARRCGRRHAEPRTQRRIGGVAHGDLLHALGNQRVRAVLAGSRRSRNRSPACFATPRNAPPCRGRARIRVERYLRRSGLIVLVASVPRRGCYGRRPRHKLVARGKSPIDLPVSDFCSERKGPSPESVLRALRSGDRRESAPSCSPTSPDSPCRLFR
jgi:hypothetical protein